MKVKESLDPNGGRRDRRERDVEYTPTKVWSVLIGESDDANEYVDVQAGLAAMKEPQRLFLLRLATGITGREAIKLSGLKGTSTRHKKAAIEELTKLINGGKP